MTEDQVRLRAALSVATWSKDPSTQNGAIVYKDGHAASSGYNDWPKRVIGSWERPEKYLYTEHAERAAIYGAAYFGVSTRDATMYCPWAACSSCARAIVISGIARLVRLPFPAEGSDRWRESCRIGDEIMRQAGVIVDEIELSEPAGISLLRDGIRVQF